MRNGRKCIKRAEINKALLLDIDMTWYVGNCIWTNGP